MWTKFRFLAVLMVVLTLVGCASPAETYVRADVAAWTSFDRDNRIDRWIDLAVARGEISKRIGDALHKLNTGRRARVSHAVRQLGKEQ